MSASEVSNHEVKISLNSLFEGNAEMEKNANSGRREQTEPIPLNNGAILTASKPQPDQVKANILDILMYQVSNLITSVPRPRMPKYNTCNFYLTLNDPELDAINAAAVKEKATVRKYLKALKLHGGAYTWFFLLKELGRHGHNRLRRFLQKPASATLLFLILLGFIAAVASVAIDIFLSNMITARQTFATLGNNYFADWALWMVYGLFFAFLSACCVQHISPYIVGSGMPELKTIISGIKMDKVLSARTGIAKFFGIATIISAGFVVGRVGPFSHIVACMAEQLLKVRLFKRLRSNDFIRCNILSAACAAGVAATFGAPLGGVMFSVEISSTYFLVSNVWRGLLCSMICGFFFYIARHTNLVAHNPSHLTLFPTNFPPFPFKPFEYFFFAILGVFIGIAAGLFIYIFVSLVKARNKRPWLRDAKYWTVFLLCIIIASVDFHIPLLKNPPGKTMAMLFGLTPIDPKFNVFLHLMLYISFKYVFTMLSLCLPIPSGQVVQSFLMGAGAGRLYGEVLKLFLPGIDASGYSVIAAAAWAASTTRSYSMILIILEMSGQFTYLMPSMVCTVISVSVASCISDSIYNIMIKVRNLPYLAMPDVYTGQNIMAYNIMETKIDVISTNSSLGEIQQLLKKKDHTTFPVVDTFENRLLLGEVHRSKLQEMVNKAIKMSEIASNIAKKNKSFESAKLSLENVIPPREPTDVQVNDEQQIDITEEVEMNNVQLNNVGKVDKSSTGSDVAISLFDLRRNDDGVRVRDPNQVDDPLALPNLPASFNNTNQVDLRNDLTQNEQTAQNTNSMNNGSGVEHSSNMRIVIHAAKYIIMNKNGDYTMLEIDPSPFCITELTSMNKIYYLFTMLGLSHAWVTSFGKLTGVLTKKQMIKVEIQMDKALGKDI